MPSMDLTHLTTSVHTDMTQTCPPLSAPLSRSKLQPLLQALYANAAAVTSTRGGGAMGHLGMIMPAAEYLALDGTVAWDDPAHPGDPPQFAANTTAVVRDNENNTYYQQLTDFQRATAVNNHCKQLILKTVPPELMLDLQHSVLGYTNVSARRMIEHLLTNYGTVTQKDLETNKELLTKLEWDPSTDINNLWGAIKKITDYNTQFGGANAAHALSDAAIIAHIERIIKDAGIMSLDLRDWKNKPEADRATVQQCKTFFNTAYKEYLKTVTAGVAGFHARANSAPVVPPNVMDQFRALNHRLDELSTSFSAISTSPGTSRNNSRSTTPSNTPSPLAIPNSSGAPTTLHYCWTMGTPPIPTTRVPPAVPKPKDTRMTPPRGTARVARTPSTLVVVLPRNRGEGSR